MKFAVEKAFAPQKLFLCNGNLTQMCKHDGISQELTEKEEEITAETRGLLHPIQEELAEFVEDDDHDGDADDAIHHRRPSPSCGLARDVAVPCKAAKLKK